MKVKKLRGKVSKKSPKPSSEMFKIMPTQLFNQDPFRKPKFIIGGFCFFYSFMTFDTELIGSIITFFLGGVLIVYTSGLEINFDRKEYRKYSSIFWRRKGYWNTFDKFKALVIIKKTGVKSFLKPSSGSVSMAKTSIFEVYFMNSTHRSRMYIKTFEDR